MLLGIDLGTGSAKAILLAIDGTVLAEAASRYPVHSPQPGWAESDPEDWWTAAALAVRAAVEHNAEQVQAIGLSGQMHGVVLVDRQHQPLRPAILWADTRASEMLSAYAQLPPELRQRLANPIAAGMAGTTLLWLRAHEPETYATARWVLQPKDWLRLRLTKAVAAEPSDASGTLLYDLLADNWAVGVIDALGLRPDWLPQLIPSSQIAGTLTIDAAEQLGLPAGLPVVAGAADTAAAMLGSGLLPGQVQLTIGTAAQIAAPRSQPVVDPHGCTHLYRAALPNQWYSLAAMQNAGLALEWARSILGFTWAEIYAEAFSVPPGCEGLTFLPYLTGERTPHLDAQIRGAWVGMGLHHTRAHLMRSALEGVAFSLRQGLEAITATGIPVAQLRLAGGGSIDPRWQQLLADVLQVPLQSVTAAAASAKGAAMLAGMGVGITLSMESAIDTNTVTSPKFNSDLESDLETAWHRFCSLYPRLRQPFI
jgi:xylulokinase